MSTPETETERFTPPRGDGCSAYATGLNASRTRGPKIGQELSGNRPTPRQHGIVGRRGRGCVGQKLSAVNPLTCRAKAHSLLWRELGDLLHHLPRFAPAFPPTTLGPVPAARMWGEAAFYMASPGKGAQPDHHPTQELRQEHGRVSGEAHPLWPTAVDFALMLALGGLVIAFVKSAAALVADSMYPMAAPSASTSDALGVFCLLVAVVATVALLKIGGC